jgi:hypothetical protein
VHQWSESQEGWTDVTCEGIGVVVVVVVFVVVLVVGLAVAVVVEMVLCIPKTKQIKCEDNSAHRLWQTGLEASSNCEDNPAHRVWQSMLERKCVRQAKVC